LKFLLLLQSKMHFVLPQKYEHSSSHNPTVTKHHHKGQQGMTSSCQEPFRMTETADSERKKVNKNTSKCLVRKYLKLCID
jgi:hypothetical protein